MTPVEKKEDIDRLNDDFDVLGPPEDSKKQKNSLTKPDYNQNNDKSDARPRFRP